MNKTLSATGSVHRKTFARFFGQGVSSLFILTRLQQDQKIRPCDKYRKIAGGDMKNSLFVRFPYLIPTIEYKKAEIRNRLSGQTKYLCYKIRTQI
jgi:hypothetical protein